MDVNFNILQDQPNRKPNKIWVDKGSKFYSKSVKSWLQHCDIEMYSTYSEGKSVFAERFIKIVRNKFINI